jgi:hypothetical protein
MKQINDLLDAKIIKKRKSQDVKPPYFVPIESREIEQS